MILGTIGWALGSAALVACLALAGPEDDEERAVQKQTFVDNCLICHGEDMTTRHRLTAKQWSAEVDKMIGWGAPVPAEKKAGLIAYLNELYSEKAPPPPPDLASADALARDHADLSSRPAPSGDASRGGPLYAKHCATCHGPDGRGADLGPILADRPILVREPAYHEVVRKGLRKMPGFVSVLNPEGESDLLAWLRSARSGSTAP